MSKIGFIGLGIMGRPMARNLLKAGHKVMVFDLFPAGVEELVSAGAARGACAKDVAGRSDIVITMLPDGPDVEKAVLGPGGVLEGTRRGSTIVDIDLHQPAGLAEGRQGLPGEGCGVPGCPGQRRRIQGD